MQEKHEHTDGFQEAFAQQLAGGAQSVSAVELGEAERQIGASWRALIEQRFGLHGAGLQKAIKAHLVRLAQGTSVQSG